MRWEAVLFPGLYLLIVVSLVYLAFDNWSYDDPFITYRYAENLAAGRGFVYNPGLRVLSTTTPLFTLLLAFFKPIFNDLHPLAVLIGAISLGAGALLLRDMSRTWETPIVGWAALAFYPTSAVLVRTLSSETPLYLAFCLGAFAVYARRAYLPAAVLAALAVLTRPDGIVLAAILGLDYLTRRNRPPIWKAMVVFAVPLLLWFTFATLYFGSPIPATLAAKQGQGLLSVSPSILDGLVEIAEGYFRILWPVLLALLAVVGLVRLYRRRAWILFLAWPVAYMVSIALLRVSSYFWYYAPLVPGIIALVGLGLDGLSTWLAARRLRIAWLVPSLIVLIAVFQLADLVDIRSSPDPRKPVYRLVGEWLSENTPHRASVAALEVGIIGYYAPNPMIDFSGLIQPDVAEIFSAHTSYDDAAIWAVETYRPDFLVLHDGLMRQLEIEYASQFCREARRIPGELYHYDRDMVIYDCRGLHNG